MARFNSEDNDFFKSTPFIQGKITDYVWNNNDNVCTIQIKENNSIQEFCVENFFGDRNCIGNSFSGILNHNVGFDKFQSCKDGNYEIIWTFENQKNQNRKLLFKDLNGNRYITNNYSAYNKSLKIGEKFNIGTIYFSAVLKRRNSTKIPNTKPYTIIGIDSDNSYLVQSIENGTIFRLLNYQQKNVDGINLFRTLKNEIGKVNWLEVQPVISLANKMQQCNSYTLSIQKDAKILLYTDNIVQNTAYNTAGYLIKCKSKGILFVDDPNYSTDGEKLGEKISISVTPKAYIKDISTFRPRTNGKGAFIFVDLKYRESQNGKLVYYASFVHQKTGLVVEVINLYLKPINFGKTFDMNIIPVVYILETQEDKRETQNNLKYLDNGNNNDDIIAINDPSPTILVSKESNDGLIFSMTKEEFLKKSNKSYLSLFNLENSNYVNFIADNQNSIIPGELMGKKFVINFCMSTIPYCHF